MLGKREQPTIPQSCAAPKALPDVDLASVEESANNMLKHISLLATETDIVMSSELERSFHHALGMRSCRKLGEEGWDMGPASLMNEWGQPCDRCGGGLDSCKCRQIPYVKGKLAIVPWMIEEGLVGDILHLHRNGILLRARTPQGLLSELSVRFSNGSRHLIVFRPMGVPLCGVDSLKEMKLTDGKSVWVLPEVLSELQEERGPSSEVIDLRNMGRSIEQ
jgi:hypothetical protein